ncbi:MAG: hypothetical protein K2J80_12310, partial [Oscillospiraceae bacterium]|nr:hypothetical protein [Oscillospiraceae bacterium]
TGGSPPPPQLTKKEWRCVYAHKRLCKANCGHKSFEKQKSPIVDIFDTKMDLNPLVNKFYVVEFRQLAQRACKLLILGNSGQGKSYLLNSCVNVSELPIGICPLRFKQQKFCSAFIKTIQPKITVKFRCRFFIRL